MSKQNARARVKQRRDQQRRKSLTAVVVIVAVVAVVIVGVLIALNAPRSSKPANITSYQGLPQDIDRTGAIGLAVGPTSAPVTLTEYSDFSCPHCRDLAPTIHQLIDEYVKPGNLRIIYKPVTFVGGAYSVAAARAAICAADQGKFMEMQDQIWALFESNGPGAYLDSTLAARANDIGLDTGQFASCYNSSDTASAIQGVADEVQRIGVDGTPTLFVDGNRLEYTGPSSLVQAIQLKLGSLTATP